MRPANRVVADFMGQVNFIPARILAVDHGSGRVALDSGLQLTLPRSPGLDAGALVEIAVRPENLRLSPPVLTHNGLAARVTDIVYLGNSIEYVVTGSGDQRLRALAHPSEVFAIGDAVAVEFDPALCTMFRRATA